MSDLRKSTRIRKPVTSIDQNLDDDDDRDAFITPKPKKSIERVSKKRPSTDDNDELELITSKKRPRKKTSTTTTAKTSPYFNTKPTEKKTDSAPIKEAKKTRKLRSKKINTSIDENTTLSNDTTSMTTKSKSIGSLFSIERISSLATTASDDSDSDDDDDGWENVQTKPNEEIAIQQVISGGNSYRRTALL